MNYRIASDGTRWLKYEKQGGVFERQKAPVGAMHAWTGEQTLCGLAPPDVDVWDVDEGLWAPNIYSCQHCRLIYTDGG